jgi:hypothetical protein
VGVLCVFGFETLIEGAGFWGDISRTVRLLEIVSKRS